MPLVFMWINVSDLPEARFSKPFVRFEKLTLIWSLDNYIMNTLFQFKSKVLLRFPIVYHRAFYALININI